MTSVQCCTPASPPVTVVALPARVDLCIYQGDDFYVDLTVTGPDGAPADLTGDTVRAQLRATPVAPDPPVAAFTCTVDPVYTNTVHLHLAATATAALSGVLVWDCELDGVDTYTLAYGKVWVTLQVTR